MTRIDEIDGLRAVDVMHGRVTTLPATATVGRLREYFGESSSRHLALLVEGIRYVGALDPAAIPSDADDATAARSFARREPTVDPDAPATEARDRALQQPSQRLPVVDHNGHLCGIVAINRRGDAFCGT